MRRQRLQLLRSHRREWESIYYKSLEASGHNGTAREHQIQDSCMREIIALSKLISVIENVDAFPG